jgi:hypothetical protein
MAKHVFQMSRRRMKRLERADVVCRELRHAIAHPSEADWRKVNDLLLYWMRVAGKDKYDRP